MTSRINQPSVKQQNRKKSTIVKIVCCFSNEVLAPYDPQKVSYHHHGKEVIAFKYEYLLQIINTGKTYFPALPRTKAKWFDIIDYLNKTRDVLNDPKKLDNKRKANTLRKITQFLDKTGLSRYVGGTAEFVRLGLKPTPLVEPVVIPKKFREKIKK